MHIEVFLKVTKIIIISVQHVGAGKWSKDTLSFPGMALQTGMVKVT
jgi:hypothetical protein